MTENQMTEAFEGVPIEITEVGGARWVRGQDITRALGFADPAKAMEQILKRSRSEFDSSTTCMVDVFSGGQCRTVRLYNARGAALIAMKAQTPKGEAFRRWVLDVLEGATDDDQPVEMSTTMPAGIRSTLRHMFIGQKGNTLLLRYRAMGLGTAEIARLLDVRPRSVNPRLRVAEYLGLVSPRPDLEQQQTKPTFQKMIDARDRAQAAYRERKALAAPAGETSDGE